MPLVRIDLNRTHDSETVRAIADGVHAACVTAFGIPETDRFQIITRHAADEIIALDADLGFTRSSDIVFVQVFAREGRDHAAKQGLYASIAENLAKLGIAGEDVFVACFENTLADWSLGLGRAQFLVGDIDVDAGASD